MLLGLVGLLWSRLCSLFGIALTGATAFVTRNPWQALVLAITAVCGVLVWRNDRLADERDAANRTIAQIKATQKVATDNQIHINQLPAIKSAAIASQSDDEAPAYFAAVSAAADTHRSIVRPATCPVSPASVPSADPAVEGVHGPAVVAGMVARPKAEDDLIVAAAARAAQMRADAQGWIADGIAVPDDGPQP